MESHYSRISISFESKLIIFALVLYSMAIFVPWMNEFCVFSRSGSSWTLRTSYIWSFMTTYDGKTFLFEKSWFQKPFTFIPMHPPPAWEGLYSAWSLIFALQILSVAYSLRQILLNQRTPRSHRKNHSTLLVGLPLTTIVLALYQWIIQNEIGEGRSIHYAYLDLGFWLAAVSVVILLPTMRIESAQPHFNSIPKAFKKTLKKEWPIIASFLITAFFLIGELESYTGVTKTMIVGGRTDPQVTGENHEFWRNQLSQITLVANLFKAVIVYNSPGSGFCELEVPVINYRILQTILRSMGYFAREPMIFHID